MTAMSSFDPTATLAAQHPKRRPVGAFADLPTGGEPRGNGEFFNRRSMRIGNSRTIAIANSLAQCSIGLLHLPASHPMRPEIPPGIPPEIRMDKIADRVVQLANTRLG